MRRLGLMIVAALLLTGCNSSETRFKTLPSIGRIDVNVAGKPSVLDLKSGLMRVTARTSSDPAYNYAIYDFTLANFDLIDVETLALALKTDTSQVVSFKLLGPSGSNKDTPLKVGNYSTNAPGLPKFESLSLAVLTVVNGEQNWNLSRNSPVFETHGEVKITEIEGETIRGEINVNTGSHLATRGQFTAQTTLVEPKLSKP